MSTDKNQIDRKKIESWLHIPGSDNNTPLIKLDRITDASLEIAPSKKFDEKIS